MKKTLHEVHHQGFFAGHKVHNGDHCFIFAVARHLCSSPLVVPNGRATTISTKSFTVMWTEGQYICHWAWNNWFADLKALHPHPPEAPEVIRTECRRQHKLVIILIQFHPVKKTAHVLRSDRSFCSIWCSDVAPLPLSSWSHSIHLRRQPTAWGLTGNSCSVWCSDVASSPL